MKHTCMMIVYKIMTIKKIDLSLVVFVCVPKLKCAWTLKPTTQRKLASNKKHGQVLDGSFYFVFFVQTYV